jgi:transposase-like protein
VILDELFVRINGQQHYLWRAVDQDGDVIDILLQPVERSWPGLTHDTQQFADS